MKNKKSIYHYLRLFKNTNIAYNKFGITSLSQKKGLFKDLKRAYFDYGWEPYEYFQFEFFNKSVDEIKSYIPTKEHIKMVYFFNTEEDIKFLQNKYKTYTRYKDFFKRQVAYITKRNADVLTSMLKSHDRLILKPVDGTFGEGVRVINCKDYVDNHFLLFQEYPSGDFLVEELIDQLDDLARLHPASVNTIRIYSICYGSEVVVFHPWLRIGKGGSVLELETLYFLSLLTVFLIFRFKLGPGFCSNFPLDVLIKFLMIGKRMLSQRIPSLCLQLKILSVACLKLASQFSLGNAPYNVDIFQIFDFIVVCQIYSEEQFVILTTIERTC